MVVRVLTLRGPPGERGAGTPLWRAMTTAAKTFVSVLRRPRSPGRKSSAKAPAERGAFSFRPEAPCRHTHGTLALTSGVPLHVSAARLGDRPETILQTYAHLLPQSDVEPAAQVAALIVVSAG